VITHLLTEGKLTSIMLIFLISIFMITLAQINA
jgi:hypothetical protein